MPRNQDKDYKITGSQNHPLNMEKYRVAPWEQTYAKTKIDFRRWFYIGRPELDENGDSKPDNSGLEKKRTYNPNKGSFNALCLTHT